MNELKNRGVDDVLFAVVDGLKGFPMPSPPSSPSHRADLHRPLDPPQPELRVVAGP